MFNQEEVQKFIKFINLTLCIEVEINSMYEFVEFEIISSRENGYSIQLDKFNDFKTFHLTDIRNHFCDSVFDKIHNENNDRIPNIIDYMECYNNLYPGFWQNFVDCSNFLRTESNDLYGINNVNQLIEQSYPGIEHNPNLLPHVELIKFFKTLA